MTAPHFLMVPNIDRKSYISNVERGRRISPTNVRRIAEALSIERHEVPPELRWPEEAEGEGWPYPHDTVAAVVADLQGLVERRVSLPPLREYRRNLIRGLRFLERWTGPPFGLRSLGVSLTFAFAYTIFCGLVAYVWGGGAVGAVTVFAAPPWAATVAGGTLALALAMLLIATGVVCYAALIGGSSPSAVTVPGAARGRAGVMTRFIGNAEGAPGAAAKGSLGGVPRRHGFLVRATLLGGLLGMAALAAGGLGADETAVACFMAVVAFAAMATRGRREAALAGTSGGMLAGVVAGLLGDQGAVEGVVTGLGMGFLVGGISGYCAAAVAETAPHKSSAALTGAGVGVAVAAVITIATLTAAYQALDAQALSLALDAEALSVFLVVWVVFPLTNAAIDYVSLGISHSLGLLAVTGTRSVRGISILTAYDLAAAVALMVATVVALATGLVLADLVSPWELGPRGFFEAGIADPFGAGIWLSMMIISTLAWTVMHCAFVIAPAAAALLASTVLQSRLVEAHRRDRAQGRMTLPTVMLATARPYLTVLAAAVIFALGLIVVVILARHIWEMLGAVGMTDGVFSRLAAVGFTIVELMGGER